MFLIIVGNVNFQGDNPRERALDMMMGGRLEANVEEDLFKVSHVICHMTRLLSLAV